MLPIISGCQSIIFPFNVTKQKPEYWIATTVKYGVTTFCTTSRQFGMANINVVSEKAKRKKKPLPGMVSYCPSILLSKCPKVTPEIFWVTAR